MPGGELCNVPDAHSHHLICTGPTLGLGKVKLREAEKILQGHTADSHGVKTRAHIPDSSVTCSPAPSLSLRVSYELSPLPSTFLPRSLCSSRSPHLQGPSLSLLPSPPAEPLKQQKETWAFSETGCSVHASTTTYWPGPCANFLTSLNFHFLN